LRALGYTPRASPHETPRTLKNLVDTWLRQAVARLPNSLVPPCRRDVCIDVQRPKDAERGDFASNVALRLASAAHLDPRPLAEAIRSALPSDTALAKVEIAGAGFLNFFLSESLYHAEIRRANREAREFGKSDLGRGCAVKIEVASVNAEGPLNAGHARRAAHGASVAALLEATGYRLVRECRVAPASRMLAQGPGGARSARAECRGLNLTGLRRELSEYGVTFDSWRLGWGSPPAVRARAGGDLGGSSAIEGAGPVAAVSLRGGRQRPAALVPQERVTLRTLRAEVGNDAVRLFFVLRASDQPLLFDLDLAAGRSLDNPLYCVQYAHARIRSVQRQLEDRGLPIHPACGAASLGLLTEPLERRLMRRLSAYREVVEQSANERAPHLLARYLGTLAEDFHTYYAAHPLVVSDAPLRDARLALVSAAQVVIQNGLRLLGVASPDSV
jgi:arginyl-tRNA synthetase